ncbi:hypothetical protein, partial [Sphingobium psychrophilum]|uniref:hypothetical protein n=1 Tax=Sphingobium psychrophilum TaxID=2728834 RepID=UPI0019D27BA8
MSIQFGTMLANDALVGCLIVTVRLLPRLMGLEARGEFGIVDKVIEELVPGLGRETSIAEH